MTHVEIRALVNNRAMEVFSPLFDKKLNVKFSRDEEPNIQDYQCDVLNMFLTLDPFFIITIQQLMYAHCKLCKEAADYGIPQNDPAHPCYGFLPADIVSKYTGPTVYIPQRNSWKHLFCFLAFNPKWEVEHGVGIVVKDGSIMGFADYQDYYFDFEDPDPS